MTTHKVTPMLPIPKRKRGERRLTSSIRVSERIWLYAKDHYNVAQTIEHLLRIALQNDGVDLSKPHPEEFYTHDVGPDMKPDPSRPLTYSEAKAKGMADGLSTDEIEAAARAEPEGAVL